MTTFILGSRGSVLALIQTHFVIQQISQNNPGVSFEVRKIKTQGDVQRHRTLSRMGGKGVFVKEIQQALLAGEVQAAVHSCKDLPVECPPGLEIVAILRRDDPRDALVSRSGLDLKSLPQGALLGTGSPRRAAQIRALRPDLQIGELRGNLDTRLRKVHFGAVEAVVVAAAGLDRMGYQGRITQLLPCEACIPAVGQGALAVEIRADNDEARRLLAPLDHPPSRNAVTAERAFLEWLGGGCHSPIAALGEVQGGRLTLRGMVAASEGDRLLKDTVEGDADSPEQVGRHLAERLSEQGAAEFLEV
ncbi:MAG: hydroxymethylbilane synthase [Dehalococcoidia bacterium]|nr:hydroxymethylbilane synthase [Dehalococcoidia bacterium]MDP7469901.1 hydroxymethylbilane synthase [Dehalococcoidia bacterium]